MFCSCVNNQTVEIIGLCDMTLTNTHLTTAWTEISIPEALEIPSQKPDVESVEKVFVNVKIISKRLVVTPVPTTVGPPPAPSPATPNQEGTLLSGFKLVVEGLLTQKIIYTADEPTQSVHSADFSIPFSAFIVVAGPATTVYCVDVCVEDVFVKVLSARKIFKNTTLLLSPYIP